MILALVIDCFKDDQTDHLISILELFIKRMPMPCVTSFAIFMSILKWPDVRFDLRKTSCCVPYFLLPLVTISITYQFQEKLCS